MFGENELTIDEQIEYFLEIFTLEEFLFRCEMTPQEAVKILYLNGHLELPRYKPL